MARLTLACVASTTSSNSSHCGCEEESCEEESCEEDDCEDAGCEDVDCEAAGCEESSCEEAGCHVTRAPCCPASTCVTFAPVMRRCTVEESLVTTSRVPAWARHWAPERPYLGRAGAVGSRDSERPYLRGGEKSQAPKNQQSVSGRGRGGSSTQGPPSRAPQDALRGVRGVSSLHLST